MKHSNILRWIIGSQILGLMTTSCALSMQRETSINDLGKDPVRLISSFLSLKDCGRLIQTSKRFKGFIEVEMWKNSTASFDLSTGTKKFESLLNQLDRLNGKEQDTQETKEEQATESTNKKRKKAVDNGENTNKKAKAEVAEVQEKKHFKQIHHLDLCGVNEGNINKIEALLNKHKDYIKDVSVKLCDMRSWDCSSYDGKLTAEFIKNTSITSIDLSNIRISNEGVQTIANALKENKTIRSVNLSVYPLNIESISILLNQRKSRLKDVSVNFWDSFSDDGNLIAEFIKNTSITSIDLSDIDISNEDAQPIAKALKENKTITSIDLSKNDFTITGAKAFADALKENKTLTSINLSLNNISIGVIYIAKALKENTTITSINLSEQNIYSDAAKALAETLKENKTIRSIDLSNSNICDVGVKHIAEALKKNKTITLINLSNSNISETIKEQLRILAQEKNITIIL